MKLTNEQIRQYRAEGYLALQALISPERLAAHRAVFDELIERSRSLAESRDGFNLAPDERGQPIPGAEDVRLRSSDGIELCGCYIHTTAPRRKT